MRSPKRILLFALFAAFLLAAMGSLVLRPRDPLFHGKPESAWIAGITYGMSLSDDQNREQSRQWREFGPEGLRVLSRALDKNEGRTYRKLYRWLVPKLPGFLVRLLPAPKTDSMRAKRMIVLDLLGRMGKDARAAIPAVSRALTDEDPGVRQIAITFFTHPENEEALLNQMPAKEKRDLLPEFIHALEDRGANWGLRNNAALALEYYREDPQIVGPVLVKALQDPAPYVRLIAAEALNRVDPDAAKKAGAVSVLIKLLQDPDDQVAAHAASKLRQFQREPELAVPALIEALQSTNTNLACDAVWSLESGFAKQAEVILPALRKASARKDSVGGYARTALMRLEAVSRKSASQ